MKRFLNMLQITVCMFVYNLTVVAFSWCFKLITDSLALKQFDQFNDNIRFAILVVVIQVVSNYLFIKGKNRYVQDTMIRVKSTLITRILNYSIPRFYEKDKTEYQSFLFNDLSTYEQNVVTGRIDIMEKLTLLLFSGAAIIVINPAFLLLFVFSLVFSIMVPVIFARFAKKYNTILSNMFAKATDKIVEMLDGFLVLRTFAIEKKGVFECENAIGEMESAKNNLKSVMAVIQSALMFMTTVLTLIIFVYGGRAVVGDQITVGELITLIQLLFHIANPLMGIMNSVSNIKAAQPIVNKYKEFILRDIQSGKKEILTVDTVNVKNLSFGYEKEKKLIIDNLSFTFEKNKKYAIIGENGSGKSTLLKLLAGVIAGDCYQGNIEIGGVERKVLLEKSFWQHVAYIPQQVFLFKKSIMDNIFPNGKEENESECESLINSMGLRKIALRERDKLGYDTELSGGEKQKVAFIREIMKDSSLILADEPDSALDMDSKLLIQDILLYVKKMCIVVTHRIDSSLDRYDEILVMDQGKIVESGTYQELMERKGNFYRMNLKNA